MAKFTNQQKYLEAKREVGLRENLKRRFEDKYEPEPNSGCWIWTAYLKPEGYGMIHTGSEKLKTSKPSLAHRVAYEFYRGSIPEGLELDHLCRTRCCVNPYHLEPVTRKENQRRGIAGQVLSKRNTSKTHCPQGHPYSGENLYIYKTWRQCRTCMAERKQRHKLKNAKTKTHCSNGHPFTDENFKIYKGWRICRDCIAESIRLQKLKRSEVLSKANKFKTHCPKGHPYADENLIVYKNQRVCRTCSAERSRRQNLDKKVKTK